MTDDHTSNYDSATDHDSLTAGDIADFTHHLAKLRYGQPHADDPAERVLILARKANLLARIATQHTRTDPDYAEPVLQLARAAEQAALHLPLQRVGPTHRRTRTRQRPSDGARSREKSGASSG